MYSLHFPVGMKSTCTKKYTQSEFTGMSSVRLSFQTSKSATTMFLSSTLERTPSRSTSNTLKQTKQKKLFWREITFILWSTIHITRSCPSKITKFLKQVYPGLSSHLERTMSWKSSEFVGLLAHISKSLSPNH